MSTQISTSAATFVAGLNPKAIRARLQPVHAGKRNRWRLSEIAQLAGLPVERVGELAREFDAALDETRTLARKATQ